MPTPKERIDQLTVGIESAAELIRDSGDLSEVGGLATDIVRSGKQIRRIVEDYEPPTGPGDPGDPGEPDPPEPDPPTVTPVGELHEIEIETTISKPTGGSYCMVIKEDNRTVRKARFEYNAMGINVPKHDPVDGTVGLMLDECEFVSGLFGDWKGWGVRGYDMGGTHYRRCNFTSVIPFANRIEHGDYDNRWAGGLYEDCRWINVPGQASQHVWSDRPGESANFTGLSGKDIPGDWLHYQRGGIFNCGAFHNGRASFALSMFRGQVGLKLESFTLQKDNESRIHGALLFDGNHHTQALELLDVGLYYVGQPDREAIQVWRPKYALVDKGEYVAERGVRVIDWKPDTIEVKPNVQGPAPLWLGRKEKQPNGTWKTVWHVKTTMAAAAGTTL